MVASETRIHEIEPQASQRLASFIRQGRIVLFTGAGFSVGASTKSGKQVPDVQDLASTLWSIAFPREPFEESSIGDIYEAALSRGKAETIEAMRDLLTVDPSGLGAHYGTWFSMPWYRIYTVNIDDLANAAERAFDLPRPLQILSALEDVVPAREAERLQVIHLNGSLEDLPEVTFSSRQYGQRGSGLDLWMGTLAVDLQTRPVLYVGTSLNEPPLWSYIEARGGKRTKREMRPGSFLISPSLDKAKAASLSLYNVTWVQDTTKTFSSEVLEPLKEDAAQGLRAIERQAKAQRGGPPVQRVTELQDDSRGDEREFLVGREPRWSDLTNGFAVRRSFDDMLDDQYGESPSTRLHVITGTAGSGKSTAAMRLALKLAGLGSDVYVLNRDAEGDLRALLRAVKATPIDVLLVDDSLSDSIVAQKVIEMLHESPEMTIIACIRSSKMRILDDLRDCGLSSREYVVPLLEEKDTDALLDALGEANRLGRLKGLNRGQQREVMERTFGRQLLVALLEVTQGVRFEEKIETECQQLENEAPLLYGIAALASVAGGSVTEADLISASIDAITAVDELQRLLGRHLLIKARNDQIQTRHAVIADRVVQFFRAKGSIGQMVTALISGLAANHPVGHELRRTKSGRLLVKLINHEFLTNLVYKGSDEKKNVSAVRSIYEAIEPVLSSDYHFWVQRGTFETKENSSDLSLASNYLEQAKSMAPNDLNVKTQWSYMMLKRASRQASSAGAADDAQLAFEELEEVIDARGSWDRYPFHVYGSQGLAWARRAPLSFDQRKGLLEQLRYVVGEGLQLHRGDKYLTRLKSDLDREYMSLAVSGQT